jgi:hypothetical protein
MATMAQLLEAEHRTRELLIQNDLPQPDRIEYGFGTVWLHWKDRKVVVAIDVDEPPPEESSGPDSPPG